MNVVENARAYEKKVKKMQADQIGNLKQTNETLTTTLSMLAKR